MLHDYGSRDGAFININASIRQRLVSIVDGGHTHTCVPLQGSGTFVVEAMVGTFVPADGKLLILVNGAYGHRIARICEYLGRQHLIQETAEDTPTDVAALDKILAQDQDITHVAVVYCETTSGILNPIAECADVVARHQRRLLIDAMSAFGALPLSARKLKFDAVVASSNKCLEGSPGIGFCIADMDALSTTQGNSPSLCMDLYDQWRAMEGNGQWRFTPPTHAILALDRALTEFEQEGGTNGRYRRYRENCDILVAGMRDLGFRTLLPNELQAPIIVTFHMPARNFEFDDFYSQLQQQGYIIYPGKLTVADSFRIGCIGRLGHGEMHGVVAAVTTILGTNQIKNTP